MQPVGLGIQAGPAGERLVLREATPADEPLAHTSFQGLSEETRHNRFMAAVNEIPADILASLRHPDPERELMIVCLRLDDAGREVEPVGAARLIHLDDGRGCEFGIVLVDAWQRHGVGARLLRILIDNAQARGLRYIRGHVLATNEGMLRLARALGFAVADSEGEGRSVKEVELMLGPDAPSPA